MARRWTMLAMLLALTILYPVAVVAQEVWPPVPPVEIFPLEELWLEEHMVSVSIDNQLAVTNIEQVLTNETGRTIEGEYLLPIPADASVSGFRMWVDGRPVEAQLLEAEEARDLYEDIVRRRKDPALLEYVGQQTLKAHLYPIAPRGSRRIELEYAQVLPKDDGLVKLVSPLLGQLAKARPIGKLQVKVEIKEDRPLSSAYSPSHEVDVERRSDTLVSVSYLDEEVRPERDFILYYGFKDQEISLDLLDYRAWGEAGYYAMLLNAPHAPAERQIVAKDLFFVLDSSGSMRGEKLAQAKDAAAYVLRNLNPEDRFNLLTFSTGTRQYASEMQSADDVEDALHFIVETEAGGGTNIGRAMDQVLRQTKGERPQVVVFLTDGLPTEGETRIGPLLERIDELASDAVRTFVFGVGYDVNTVLLDRMAQDHHGTSVYVRPEEDIERAVSSFYDKISTPVLTDIALTLEGVAVEDVYPYPLPDLFAGQQLVVVGRYREPGTAQITLEGIVNGRTERYTFDEVSFGARGGEEAIARLWATRKVGYLLSEIRLHGQREELVEEVIALAERYGILTPYTSFFVDETEDSIIYEGASRSGPASMPTVLPAPQGAHKGLALGLNAADSGTGGAVGEMAVEGSIEEQTLREADVASENDTDQIKMVADKTFVLRDGVWTDTVYDAEIMAVEQISFGSQRYFTLLDEDESLRRYLAVGCDVLLVWEGQAYRVSCAEAVDQNGQLPVGW